MPFWFSRPRKLDLTFASPLVIEVKQPPPPPPSQAGVWVTVNCGGFKVKSKGPTVYTLPGDKMITVAVAYTDAAGHPAEVDGEVTWDTSDPNIIAVKVNTTDSKTCSVIPSDNLGQAQVTATADADLGEGVVEIVCVLDINVVSGQAVAGVITPVGAPQPIPPEGHVDNTLPGDLPHPDQSLPQPEARSVPRQ